jgi:hypothetical protein
VEVGVGRARKGATMMRSDDQGLSEAGGEEGSDRVGMGRLRLDSKTLRVPRRDEVGMNGQSGA